ncbi:lysophospholipase L1-like esterase [Actinoplanes lutulentus]|uniref:Lysophospholipase L1-like esterase n=1 Tax=Actinoplanes lutulentus TaxID=1287878 RepID=A0A327ZE14_9ACTN|nr:SGNH/GDSL hydrolase family protein [Actinoplanes lutulentus]MBB2942639.1 lysophospholipase L1-like esterase [Actinoplanes lutulentus]RAK38220.1 lysophospholipase L1-like esterase [Actinoplanes lutulentus]
MRLLNRLVAVSLAAVVSLAVPHAAEAAPMKAQNTPIRIMPLGDSLTFGKGDRTENGYRTDLHTWLTAAGVDTDFVGSQANGSGADTAHEGHPGWRISWITRHTGYWMRKYKPQVVLLDIGTNDLLRHQAPGAPQRLDKLIDKIIATDPDTRIVLAKLLIVKGKHEREFRSFNAKLAKAAARHPGKVTLVDMSVIPASDTVDGVHPSQAGYRKMAAQWYQGLRKVLPMTTPVTPDR